MGPGQADPGCPTFYDSPSAKSAVRPALGPANWATRDAAVAEFMGALGPSYPRLGMAWAGISVGM
jgi:hypothetical protein